MYVTAPPRVKHQRSPGSNVTSVTLDGLVQLSDHRWLFFVLFLSAYLFVLVSDSLVVYVIWSQRSLQLHSPTNLLLLSLAVSDFFVGLLLIPIETLKTGTCWVLGDLLCALYFLIPYILISASVGSMVLISVDRYVAICDPMHYSTRITDKVVTISVCLCWICSCLVNIAGDVDLVVAFIIPITVIVALYMRVFVVAVSQARAMRSHVRTVTVQNTVTLTTKKSELKAARTLGVVVVVFLICYSPYYYLSLTGGSILVGSSTETFMSFLMYFNSCLNPVIYAFFYPWFRKAVKHIVTLQILQPGSCDANVL
uniref:G-protein coupled receptors family 1 profile domain-containing protein n=1 Tax=Lates calcarifer TaxID=8187 RepID=A0A4W6ERJ4_LATCA